MADKQQRILSIDALRGFDMLWIVGLGTLVGHAGQALGTPLGSAIAGQMEHAFWEGLNFFDIIFPLFVFLAGASWPFSLDSQRRKGASDGRIALRILKRFLILFALGLVYGNFFKFDFAHLRFNSVLGRVGFGWAVAAATLLFCRRLRSVVFWAVGIFAAYALVSWLVPVLSGSANPWSPRQAAAPYLIDQWITPGRTVGKVLANGKANGFEGFFSAFGCIPTAFLGMFCGMMLKCREWSQAKKSAMLAVFAAALLAAGGVSLLLGCPCVKPSWNPTYILVSGGISAAALALFHWVIDVKGFTKWCFPFQVIGMNSITVYMFHRLFDLRYTSKRFMWGLSDMVPPQWHDAVISLGAVAVAWLAMYWLYRRKIFIKV